MIVRRGKDYTGSVWENEVALSSGLTAKGRPRKYIALINYSSFKTMTGITIKPGKWVEIAMTEVKRTPLPEDPERRFCRGERG